MEDVVIDASFWQGRRVFVTGHTGFKGAWLTLWLQALGARVAGFALAPPTRPSLFEVGGVGHGIASTIADIRDASALAERLAAHRPDIVFHLAAQSLVRSSYVDPVGTFATNVMGTIHLLEAVRAAGGVSAVVVATSDKCYANDGSGRPHQEDDSMGGDDPYSASKGAAEIAVAAWRKSYFSAEAAPRVATVRAGNVIGGGDWAADRLVPDILRAAKSGTPVVLRYPRATRPWQHVLDALNGYLVLAERLSSPEGRAYARGWNFGPSNATGIAVADFVERLDRLLGAGSGWTAAGGPQPPEAPALVLDSSLARARLGWRPKLTLDEALLGIVLWHAAHDAGSDMQAMTLHQIARFQALEAKIDA